LLDRGWEEKLSEIDNFDEGYEVRHTRISELSGSEPSYPPQAKRVVYYGGDHMSVPELTPDVSPESQTDHGYSGPPEEHYVNIDPRPRRRGATKCPISGRSTPSDRDSIYEHPSGSSLHALKEPDVNPKGILGLDDTSFLEGVLINLGRLV
jgi:hypothetical protein